MNDNYGLSEHLKAYRDVCSKEFETEFVDPIKQQVREEWEEEQRKEKVKAAPIPVISVVPLKFDLPKCSVIWDTATDIAYDAIIRFNNYENENGEGSGFLSMIDSYVEGSPFEDDLTLPHLTEFDYNFRPNPEFFDTSHQDILIDKSEYAHMVWDSIGTNFSIVGATCDEFRSIIEYAKGHQSTRIDVFTVSKQWQKVIQKGFMDYNSPSGNRAPLQINPSYFKHYLYKIEVHLVERITDPYLFTLIRDEHVYFGWLYEKIGISDVDFSSFASFAANSDLIKTMNFCVYDPESGTSSTIDLLLERSMSSFGVIKETVLNRGGNKSYPRMLPILSSIIHIEDFTVELLDPARLAVTKNIKPELRRMFQLIKLIRKPVNNINLKFSLTQEEVLVPAENLDSYVQSGSSFVFHDPITYMLPQDESQCWLNMYCYEFVPSVFDLNSNTYDLGLIFRDNIQNDCTWVYKSFSGSSYHQRISFNFNDYDDEWNYSMKKFCVIKTDTNFIVLYEVPDPENYSNIPMEQLRRSGLEFALHFNLRTCSVIPTLLSTSCANYPNYEYDKYAPPFKIIYDPWAPYIIQQNTGGSLISTPAVRTIVYDDSDEAFVCNWNYYCEVMKLTPKSGPALRVQSLADKKNNILVSRINHNEYFKITSIEPYLNPVEKLYPYLFKQFCTLSYWKSLYEDLSYESRPVFGYSKELGFNWCGNNSVQYRQELMKSYPRAIKLRLNCSLDDVGGTSRFNELVSMQLRNRATMLKLAMSLPSDEERIQLKEMREKIINENITIDQIIWQRAQHRSKRNVDVYIETTTASERNLNKETKYDYTKYKKNDWQKADTVDYKEEDWKKIND